MRQGPYRGGFFWTSIKSRKIVSKLVDIVWWLAKGTGVDSWVKPTRTRACVRLFLEGSRHQKFDSGSSGSQRDGTQFRKSYSLPGPESGRPQRTPGVTLSWSKLKIKLKIKKTLDFFSEFSGISLSRWKKKLEKILKLYSKVNFFTQRFLKVLTTGFVFWDDFFDTLFQKQNWTFERSVPNPSVNEYPFNGGTKSFWVSDYPGPCKSKEGLVPIAYQFSLPSTSLLPSSTKYEVTNNSLVTFPFWPLPNSTSTLDCPLGDSVGVTCGRFP